MNRMTIAAGAALAIFGTLAWYWSRGAPTELPAAYRPVVASSSTTGAKSEQGHERAPVVDARPAWTIRLANPLERADDLRAVFDKYRSSRDQVERAIAYRAWSACFPAVITAQGRPVSMESFARAIPSRDPNREQRFDAYRELHERCEHFSGMPHEQIASEIETLKKASLNGTATTPGERANRAYLEGRTEEALRIARETLASADPFAIASLREFAGEYFWEYNDTHPHNAIPRPDLRALAMSIAACELGLDCEPDSLTALQLCANAGHCDGSVADRYKQSLPSDADRETVQSETARILDAVRTGNISAIGF